MKPEAHVEGFLSRWSRLKRQAVATTAPASDAAAANQSTMGEALVPATESRTDSTAAPAAAPAAGAHAGPSSQQPELQLPAVDTLTFDSDFAPFFQPQVPDHLRRAAVKKLFADPHFNVMDGLDVYIDDYSKPDPLPAGMLAKMVHARDLIDHPTTRRAREDAAAAAASAESNAVSADTNAASADTNAASAESNAASVESTAASAEPIAPSPESTADSADPRGQHVSQPVDEPKSSSADQIDTPFAHVATAPQTHPADRNASPRHPAGPITGNTGTLP